MSTTVLMAVYNGGAYLREAVASVLAQTYTDFELLLVDDASGDGAVDALPPDPRIRVLRNDRNIGQIPSLNRGLREAKGTYIARLDHDDVCLPTRLARQIELLDRMPDVALVATWADVVEDGRIWTRIRPHVDSYVEFAAGIVAYRLAFAHPSLMFRRDEVLELGGFDESLSAAEDMDLYRRLVLARRDARVVPETLVLYRRHDAQMTYAKAALVNQSDARSYERFVSELAPNAPARLLRLLFMGDVAVWNEPALAQADLDAFLVDASNRLQLTGDERVRFARALARRAASTALAGWPAGTYGRHTRTALAFAARHGGSAERALAATQPLLLASAPAGRPVAAVRSSLHRVLASESLTAPRRLVRRSRALRWLYSRVVDVRPPRD